ncbi:MAG TPA: right-handed parallel beta-helix repeat-containing protein, partial [Clostridia bacterium]|nr:right-handed parallel beta-helix repeat-containing protein [Clostridia bacterium]
TNMPRMIRQRSILLCFIACLVTWFSLFALPARAEEAFWDADDLFVAVDGSDGNPGTLEAPLASVAEAKERLKGVEGTEPVTVWLRGGTYFLSEMLVFNESDRNGVTFASYPGETAVISGAKPITFQETQALNGNTVWVRSIQSSEAFRALYDSNGFLQAARFPKEGYFTVQAVSEEEIVYKETDAKTHYLSFYSNPPELRDNLLQFTNPADILLRMLHLWKDEMATLTWFNPYNGSIGLSRPTSLTISPGDRYYLEQVKEALTEPGEWYLDRALGLLYYRPYPDQRIEDTTLYAGSLRQLMIVDSMKDLTFENIAFTHTDWEIPNDNQGVDFAQAAYDVESAIYVQNTESLLFKGCTFRELGGTAVLLGRGVTNSGVTECLFQDIGANAIFVHGVNLRESELSVKNIIITGNHICRYGRVFNNAVGVLVVHARNCAIANNEIHDGYYTAISAGWVWGYGYSVTSDLQIADNLIYDIGQERLSDMGGIYLLGVQNGTVVSGNVIHDVIATHTEDGGYGGWGIYLDEGASYIEVKNNLVYRCGSQGLHQNYGRENVVENNIFADNLHGQVAITAKETHVSMNLKRNIIVGDASQMFADSPTGATKDTKNLYWDRQNPQLLAASLQKAGHYATAVLADPGFADPGNGDYRLVTDAAAEQIQFVPWDYDQAGPWKVFDVH